MNSNKLQRKNKKFGLILSLALGLLIFSGISVSAQNRDNRDSGRERNQGRSGERRNDQRAEPVYNQQNTNDGYYDRNGVYHPNDNGNYPDNRNYPKDNGNYPDNRNYPDDNSYYGNNGYNSLYSIARQNGYQDGFRKGAEDMRERHYDPTRTSEYRKGTNGYYKGLGDKKTYKDVYRQAFLRGFDQGQNQNRNNGRNNRRRGY